MNQLEQFREKCAVTAWNHYMDTCKRLNRAPASYEEFIASSAIRALPLPEVKQIQAPVEWANYDPTYLLNFIEANSGFDAETLGAMINFAIESAKERAK